MNPLTQTVTITGSIFVSSPNPTMGQFVGNQNGYVEFSVRNTNTGVSASGDIAVYADNGTVLDRYIDMGINNSGMSPNYYYGGANFGAPLDAYMYNVGGNLRVGTANANTPSQSLFLFANPYATPDMVITGSRVGIQKSGSLNATLDVNGSTMISGSLTVSGSYIQTGYHILTTVSQSLNFADDIAAAAGGVPLGGLYRNGNFILIRLS